jgi:hypothetical protein
VLCTFTSTQTIGYILPQSEKQKLKVSRYRHAEDNGRGSYYSFLTSALDWVSGQRHAQAALYPRERTPGIHWIGGWVGLRAGLHTPLPLPGIEPRPHGCPVCSQTRATVIRIWYMLQNYVDGGPVGYRAVCGLVHYIFASVRNSNLI